MNIYIYIPRLLMFDNKRQNIHNTLYGGIDVNAQTILKWAKLYPNNNYYIGGSNNISELDECPKNLIDLYGSISNEFKGNTNGIKWESVNERTSSFNNFILSYINEHNIKFDLNILFTNRRLSHVCEFDKGFISKRTGEKIKWLVSTVTLTSGFIPIKFNDAPIIYFNDDITGFSWPRDLRLPTNAYTQCNFERNVNLYKENSLIDTEPHTLYFQYKPIEKLWLSFRKKIDFRTFPKTNEFEVWCNCDTTGDIFKYNYIKKWILDYRKDQIIYGTWYKANGEFKSCVGPDAKKENFKVIPMMNMEDVLWNTRYTLIIPTGKHTNFLSQKVYSMIYFGIIPFWCKYDYDTDNIYKEIPDYVKVESPDELYKKIDELNNDEKKYRGLLEQLYNCLDDKYFSDEFFHELFDDIMI